MNLVSNKHFCNYQEMVQDFDPAATYMVLNCHGHLGGGKASDLITNLLSGHLEETTEIKICQYGPEDQYALVIKTDAIDINATFNEFIVRDMQDQFNCCIYSPVDR